MHVESTLGSRARRLELSPATFRKLALSSAVWLWLIVVSGATVRLTASGLGCEHWPGCTAGNPFPEQELPLVHRVRQPDRQRRDDPRDARRLARRALHAGRAARVRRLALAHVSSARSRRRRSARSRSTRDSIRCSSCRTSCSRSSCSQRASSSRSRRSRSSADGRRSRLPQLDPARRPRRGRGAARARRHRHGLHRRRAAPGQRGRRAAVAPARRGVRARPRDRDLRRALPRVPRLPLSQPRAVAALRRGRRRAARSCCSCRWASASSSTGRICPGGSSSSTSRSRRPCGRARSRSWLSSSGRRSRSRRAPRLPRWPTS